MALIYIKRTNHTTEFGRAYPVNDAPIRTIFLCGDRLSPRDKFQENNSKTIYIALLGQLLICIIPGTTQLQLVFRYKGPYMQATYIFFLSYSGSRQPTVPRATLDTCVRSSSACLDSPKSDTFALMFISRRMLLVFTSR